MPKTALLFAGQGAQKVGMGQDFNAVSDTARTWFDRARTALGYDLPNICFTGPEEELTKTENAQPGIFLIGWIGLQSWLYFRGHNGSISFQDSPPTFFVLGFILTLTSFLFTILVLTSQRGLAEHDRIRSEIEYQVNLKAQSEIMRLQLKMDEVLKLLEEKTKEK